MRIVNRYSCHKESSRASETNAIATTTTDLKQVHIVSSFMVAHKHYMFAEWSAENQYTYLPVEATDSSIITPKSG